MDKIINYYLNKAESTLYDYDVARTYDAKYKFKDFENLSKYFTYTKQKEKQLIPQFIKP